VGRRKIEGGRERGSERESKNDERERVKSRLVRESRDKLL
jgi:hypothetical protein